MPLHDLAHLRIERFGGLARAVFEGGCHGITLASCAAGASGADRRGVSRVRDRLCVPLLVARVSLPVPAVFRGIGWYSIQEARAKRSPGGCENRTASLGLNRSGYRSISRCTANMGRMPMLRQDTSLPPNVSCARVQVCPEIRGGSQRCGIPDKRPLFRSLSRYSGGGRGGGWRREGLASAGFATVLVWRGFASFPHPVPTRANPHPALPRITGRGVGRGRAWRSGEAADINVNAASDRARGGAGKAFAGSAPKHRIPAFAGAWSDAKGAIAAETTPGRRRCLDTI
jgi:hypothetical protein